TDPIARRASPLRPVGGPCISANQEGRDHERNANALASHDMAPCTFHGDYRRCLAGAASASADSRRLHPFSVFRKVILCPSAANERTPVSEKSHLLSRDTCPTLRHGRSVGIIFLAGAGPRRVQPVDIVTARNLRRQR